MLKTTDSLKTLHNSTIYPWRWPLAAIIGLILAIACSANAQEDEPDPDAPQDPQVAQFEMQENQFDSWIFQNLRSASVARMQLDKLLDLHVDDVDRACQLADAQRTKLQLAGRGDIKRFFEKVEVVRQKFLLVRKDQNKFNGIWQDISPLQASFQGGLHGDESLFCKTLRHMLDTEQFQKYSHHEDERRKFHYRAKVELVVSMLEGALPMRDDQRQKVITLIVEDTKPPRHMGQQAYYLVLWKMSQVPESKLKPLFDDVEWKILHRQLAQGKAREQWLKQIGVLESETDGDM